MHGFFGLEAAFTGDDTNRKMIVLPDNMSHLDAESPSKAASFSAG
jgi:hypothetical protein